MNKLWLTANIFMSQSFPWPWAAVYKENTTKGQTEKRESVANSRLKTEASHIPRPSPGPFW